MDSHSIFIKVSQVVKVVNLSEFVKDLRSKVVPASKVIKVVKVKVSKVDSHSGFIKVGQAVKVVNLSAFVKNLHSKVVPASKVVQVVKLRQQSSSAE